MKPHFYLDQSVLHTYPRITSHVQDQCSVTIVTQILKKCCWNQTQTILWGVECVIIYKITKRSSSRISYLFICAVGI